jgi:hypothetical protein
VTSLMDIAPLQRTVPVQGVEVAVSGISALAIAQMMGRFPEVRNLLGGKSADITAERLFEAVPEAVAVIIAAGCGRADDEALQAKAASLPLEVQFELVTVILELTVPSGVGPFVQKLRGLMGGLGITSLTNASADGGKGRGGKSPQR